MTSEITAKVTPGCSRRCCSLSHSQVLSLLGGSSVCTVDFSGCVDFFGEAGGHFSVPLSARSAHWELTFAFLSGLGFRECVLRISVQPVEKGNVFVRAKSP